MSDNEHMELELCEPAPFMFGENGHLAVTDGETVWIVVVTEEALKATAHRAEASLKRLARYAAFYRDVAAALLARGEDGNGKIWILERDVMASPRPNGIRDLGGRTRPPSSHERM